MNKKEFKEKLNNLPKPKYLYQRYDGNLYKYEVDNNILIDVKNANNIINLDKQIILGKTSEDIIDLVEVDDYVNGERVFATENRINDNGEKVILVENYNEWTDDGVIANKDIKSIVTKEQFEKDKFEV